MEIVFLLYDGMTALDAIGPHEILCRLSNATIKRAAIQVGKIQTDSGMILFSDYTISDIKSADVLLIPGAGSATTLRDRPAVLDWIRMIHLTTTWTTSVCTGSLILGAAGILQGKKATTHWSAMDRLSKWGAESTPSRIVESGKIITAAGVSAGIDMALMLSAKISGVRVAKSIQLGIEYDPEPPFDSGSPESADSELVTALKSKLIAGFEMV